jgi:hypothetical protein
MEIFIILAYPIVWVHGKMRQISRSEGFPVMSVLVRVPAKSGT